MLQYPDFEETFILTTNASNEGLRAVLSQDGHPCCYISRTLNPLEKNYSTTEKELLAIIWSMERLRQHLLGRKFKIQSDHQALKWLKNVNPSSRLMRRRLRLEEYDYEIEYKKGKENTTDALSRLYPITDEEIQSVISSSNNSKTYQSHFKQITKTELGDFNEQHWLHQLTTHFTKRQIERLQIGMNDNSFSTFRKGKHSTHAKIPNNKVPLN